MKRFVTPSSKPTARRAFTLIEILVVLALIVLLVGLLIPAVGKMKKNAVKASATAHMHSIQQGLQAYYTDMNNQYPDSSTPPTGAYGGKIATGRGSVMLAQGLMGFLPATDDGFGPPNLNEGYGFRTRVINQAAMRGGAPGNTSGGTSYGPYVPADPNGYMAKNPGLEEFFIDPWGHEILYFRSNRAPVGNGQKIFDHPAGSAFFFNAGDCASDTYGTPLDASNGSPTQQFWQLISPGTTNTYGGGIVMGADSYLLISAGADGQYFTADDVVAGKE